MFLTAVKGESSYRVAVMSNGTVWAATTLDNGRYVVLCTLPSGTQVKVGEFTVWGGVIGPFVEQETPPLPGKYRRVLLSFLNELEKQMETALNRGITPVPTVQAEWCAFLNDAVTLLCEKILPYLEKFLEGMEENYLALGYGKGEEDLLEDVMHIRRIIATWEETFM